jgi:hypothetical protein
VSAPRQEPGVPLTSSSFDFVRGEGTDNRHAVQSEPEILYAEFQHRSLKSLVPGLLHYSN